MCNIYKLRSWIDLDKIHWDLLSQNPNAINLLEQNPDMRRAHKPAVAKAMLVK
jgi:hypothetical protein